MTPNPMKPMDNDADSASYTMGPIVPAAPVAVRSGAAPAHPELSADLPDARAVRVAAEEVPGGDYTTLGHDASRPNGPIKEHAPATHYSSTKLHTGEED